MHDAFEYGGYQSGGMMGGGGGGRGGRNDGGGYPPRRDDYGGENSLFFTLDNGDIEGIPKIPIFRYKMQIFGRKMIKI